MKKVLIPVILLFAISTVSYSFINRVDRVPEMEALAGVQTTAKDDCSHVHWSYKEGNEGPENWKDLCEGFSKCGGKVQSPINIETSETSQSGALSAIKTEYGSTGVKISNNGHTVQFDVTGENTATINKKKYKLLQFHFHAKSEHTVDGDHFPLEVHFVHQKSAKDYAVLGVMFEEGDANQLLADYLSEFPREKGKFTSKNMIDLSSLLPSDMSYYNYSGSLTTPPCSEVVNWYVLKSPLQASEEQLEQMSEILHGNFRPVMPLLDRKVLSFGD